MSLALVSGSALAGPVQWTSVDNLVAASGSIATTLNAGIRRVGGVQSGVGVASGNITPNGYLEVEAVLLTEQQRLAYNQAVGEVQLDIFQKTAAEYFGEEYEAAGVAFSNAVDAYVNAVTPIATAQHINNMAAQVQVSGDAVQGQQLQAFLNNNNVLMTTGQTDAYNNSLTVLQDAADHYAGVAAVYSDPQLVSNFQTMADADGVDFLNADSLFFDRIENQGITGMAAALVVDFTSMNSTMYVQDLSFNIQTTEFFNQAGNASTFFQQGPTQNIDTTCSIVQNGTIFQTYQGQDPNMPCYSAPVEQPAP